MLGFKRKRAAKKALLQDGAARPFDAYPTFETFASTKTHAEAVAGQARIAAILNHLSNCDLSDTRVEARILKVCTLSEGAVETVERFFAHEATHTNCSRGGESCYYYNKSVLSTLDKAFSKAEVTDIGWDVWETMHFSTEAFDLWHLLWLANGDWNSFYNEKSRTALTAFRSRDMDRNDHHYRAGTTLFRHSTPQAEQNYKIQFEDLDLTSFEREAFEGDRHLVALAHANARFVNKVLNMAEAAVGREQLSRLRRIAETLGVVPERTLVAVSLAGTFDLSAFDDGLLSGVITLMEEADSSDLPTPAELFESAAMLAA